MQMPDSLNVTNQQVQDTGSTYFAFYIIDTVPAADTNEVQSIPSMDSILAQFAPAEPIVRKSLFKGHQLHTSQGLAPQSIGRNEIQGTWTFGFLVLFVLLLSVVVNQYKFALKDLAMSLLDSRAMTRLFRDNNMHRRTDILPMGGIYAMAVSAVAYYFATRYGFSIGNGVMTFLAILAAFCGYYLIKNGLIRLVGNILEDNEAIDLYVASNYLFDYSAALISAPMLFLLFFSEPCEHTISIILLYLIIIAFVFRLLRGLQLILTNSKSSRFYLFYYICTFEIVPFLILTKVLIT